VVTEREERLVRLAASSADVAESIDLFSFQLARRIASGANSRFASRLHQDTVAILARLYEQLMAPLAQHLEHVTSLHHVPAGPLNSVPFHALHDGTRFMIERCNVTRTPSAAALCALQAFDRQTDDRAGRQRTGRLIVGVSDERAPLIDAEVDALAAAWPEAKVLRGDEATIERVVRACAEASTIHIAAHGRFPRGSPRSSGVRLADGWWTARHIESSTALRGARVTLSACEGGRLASVGGDEAAGLIRALLSAGVRELLVSEWAAQDQATLRMMARAATDLAQGSDMREAIQRCMRREICEGQHPVLWAPFVLVACPSTGSVPDLVERNLRCVVS
jgi:CHAT domain-containing protein